MVLKSDPSGIPFCMNFLRYFWPEGQKNVKSRFSDHFWGHTDDPTWSEKWIVSIIAKKNPCQPRIFTG